MQWSDISFTPPRRTLRQFAGLWILCFGGLACWHGFVAGNTTLAWALAGVAASLGPLGLLKPQFVRPIFVAWMVVAFPIGWVVTHVTLACLFYGIFMPISLVFKLAGRDVLARSPRPGQATYWAPKPVSEDVRSYFRPS